MKELRAAAQQPGINPELRKFLCGRSAMVIGASEPVATAQSELTRVRRWFPGAALGYVYQFQGRDHQQVYAGMFLSCEQAREFVQQVDAKLRTGAFIDSFYYPACGYCEGLPRIFAGARPSLLTVTHSIEKQQARMLPARRNEGRSLRVDLPAAPGPVRNVAFTCEGEACGWIYECPASGRCGPAYPERASISGRTAAWYAWTNSSAPATFTFTVYYRP
jgi:hypothetical protein